jgi:hypothetical protein
MGIYACDDHACICHRQIKLFFTPAFCFLRPRRYRLEQILLIAFCLFLPDAIGRASPAFLPTAGRLLLITDHSSLTFSAYCFPTLSVGTGPAFCFLLFAYCFLLFAHSPAQLTGKKNCPPVADS